MSVPDYYGIDYRVWADYWDLLEQHGLNAENASLLDNYSASPILILGSGQGLVSQHFLQAGYSVCSVDRSAEMADGAMRRRGISTVVCDALNLYLDQRFSTIIISTGVINERSLGHGDLSRLLKRVRSQLVQRGFLVLSYFRMTPWTLAARELGLYARPSNNTIFWRAQGDLAEAERFFVANVEHSEAAQRVFKEHRKALSRHMDAIMAVGKRHIQLGKEEPGDFIANYSGYYPFPLTRSTELLLRQALHAQQFLPRLVKSVNGGDTMVLVCEKTRR
jgi:SAM-dependent methyltransferase